MIARLAIGLLLLFSLAVPLPASAIQVLAGGAVDATVPPPPPCLTFGFSVEAISTLPVGQNNIRMVRIDRSGNTQTGYAVTSQATGYTVYVFDFKTMAVLGVNAVTPAGYRDAGRLQGDVGRTDGKLYLFHEVSTANPACPANRCVVMNRWSGSTLENTVVDTTGSIIDNIDDARESGNNFLVIVNRGSAPFVREFRTYSKSALIRIASGTQMAAGTTNGFGHVSRTLDGRMYAGSATLAVGNVWTFAQDSATADNTATIGFAVGLLLGAVFPSDTGLTFFLFDSSQTGAIIAQRSYITPPVTAAGPQPFDAVADLGASFQGSFWDSVNRKVFALRTTVAAIGSAQRDTEGLTSAFNTEETFACASCGNSGGMDTGTQIVDYNQTYARMYVGSNETPARITKIKVCATGGPP